MVYKMDKMLLHTCCAPCSTATIERLSMDYKITVLYYNPNIYPKDEYLKRKEEQLKYIQILKSKNVDIDYLDCDYDDDKFFSACNGLESEPEGGKRCSVCFALRLDFTAKKAKELGYDIFATSLTVSPHKNAQVINAIGQDLEKKYNVKYLVSDFKKKDGYKRSIVLSKENNIYRQNYCGCKFSIWW